MAPDAALLAGLVDGPAHACVRAQGTATRLVLERDAMGHRSLYWARRSDGAVVFSSSIHAVLQEVPRELDVEMVPFFLSFAYLPGTRTLARGVSALEPGTRLIFEGGSPRSERVWSLPPASDHGDEDALKADLRATLERCVRRWLPEPGAPCGATLSGGIDSSLVLAIARGLHQGPMRCYSMSFGPDLPNELEYSSAVARHLGVEQEVVELSPAQVILGLDDSVSAMSEPNGDPLTVPNSRLFRVASGFCDTLLNGEGGDPCFGGPKNGPMILADLYGESEDEPGARERMYLASHQRCFDDLPRMLEPGVLRPGAMEAFLAPWFSDSRWPRLLDALMAINVCFKGAWHILPKVDHLSLPHGVSPASPLFDRELVELAFRIPSDLKRRGAVEKHLLKEAVRDLLPATIVDRPKSGMMVPVEAWFNGPLLPFARERLIDGLAPMGLVRKPWIEDLLGKRLGGLRPRRGIKIWLLLTLESWIRTVLRAP